MKLYPLHRDTEINALLADDRILTRWLGDFFDVDPSERKIEHHFEKSVGTDNCRLLLGWIHNISGRMCLRG